jgi:dihydrofolate reductase
MTTISLVYAQSKNGVIGRDGGLPWHVSSDLKRFKAITMGKPVIMGRKTWDSLPKKPLTGRHNVVVTRQKALAAEGATVVASADAALAAAGNVPEVCVIGGGEIFDLFLARAGRIYLTVVDLAVEGDTAGPVLDEREWRVVSSEAVAAGPRDSAAFTLKVLERNGQVHRAKPQLNITIR